MKSSISLSKNKHKAHMHEKVTAWMRELRDSIVRRNHRAAVVVPGTELYGLQMANVLIDSLEIKKSIFISAHWPHALEPKQAMNHLGQEYEAIVFDAHSGIDVDAFGAISGTLVGGGVLFLLIPEQFDEYELAHSRFLQRMTKLLSQDQCLYWLKPNTDLPEIHYESSDTPNTQKPSQPFGSLEQEQAVQSIVSMVSSDAPETIVLMSDRGRGKSSALGLAAAQLLQQGIRRVVLTAPRMAVSEPVFRHASQLVPEAELHHGRLVFHDSELQFLAPDALIENHDDAEVLLVDEAASIPLPMLEDLLLRFPKIVFATTVHGYEGTGRGFTLKFFKILDRLDSGWRLIKMATPIRWSDQDPLENWIDRTLCLHAELVKVSDLGDIDPGDCRVLFEDRDMLVKDESRLLSIFSLLVNAHYRTRPSDLVYMLDADNVRLYVLEYNHRVLAAVLINEEGGFDDQLAEKIYRGERRPTGHLLAQTLSFHAGCNWAPGLKYSRIMRIAVHPELQGKGLGSRLLEQLEVAERKLHMDVIGTSFGATQDLLRFWGRSDYAMVRLGFTRDHASGTHSAVMLKAFTEKGQALLKDAQSRFRRYLPCWLDGVFHGLSEDLTVYLNQQKQIDQWLLTDQDWQDIRSFAFSHRGYETCIWALIKLIHQYSNVCTLLPEDMKQVIDARIVEKQDWPEVVKSIAATGKADAIRQLRIAIQSVIKEIEKPAHSSSS